jgi:hypothetical protein
MQRTSLTANQVADLAEKYLEKYQPPNYRIVVDRDGVHESSDGWWEIPIRPSKQDAPTFDWTGRSAEAAVDLDEAEGLHVLFM